MEKAYEKMFETLGLNHHTLAIMNKGDESDTLVHPWSRGNVYVLTEGSNGKRDFYCKLIPNIETMQASQIYEALKNCKPIRSNGDISLVKNEVKKLLRVDENART
jgi:hypothetical protein